MSFQRRFLVFTACCLLPAVCCGKAAAQSPRDKVSFADVRFGFTPGPHAGNPEENTASFRQLLYKPGAWVPVYVHVLNNGKYDERTDGPAEVVVETLDSDDAANSYRVALPSMPPQDPSARVIAYTRPGTRYTDVTVRIVRKKDGRDLCAADKSSHPGLDPQQVFYLALGSKLPNIRLPGATANINTMQAGACEIGNISRVEDMPTLWFGYSAADLVILSTSDRSFITGLLNDNAGRKAALAEWVRRGGKLLVLAGRNHDVLNGQGGEELNAVLPVDMTGASLKAAELRPSFREFITETFDPLEGPIDVTRLSPRENRSARVLASGPPEGGTAPLIVQGPYGLGRVTVVACDIDQPPFTTKWKGQTNSRDQLPRFWEQLLRQAGPRVPSTIQNQFGGRFVPRGIASTGDEGDDTLRGVVQTLENFEGVPVISFGWVALFILIYILVVGPIDYLFLKKVVKRLELTWITFPTVVVAVSAAAYFTAYALKGNDLRINKVDLVDIDLQTKQSYGRTCFSVFSPRIQNYTIGIEPAEGWVGPANTGGPDTLVTWFGAPKIGQRALFRRSYEYEDRATALRGVPIQVWSTKNFQGLWQAGFDKNKPPFTADLKHPPGKPDELIGTITSQLPVELSDAVLIYKGEVAQLGPLAPDAPRSISSQSRMKFSSWRANIMDGANVAAAGGAPTAHPNALKVDLLFHEESIGSADPKNGSMREVDQSWRVSPENRDEAILVARVPAATGMTEELTQGPMTSCRLWLGELPTAGRPRPTIPGTMRQETYVRVYVPVAAK